MTVEFKVSLHIEDDPEIPVSAVTVATDPETSVTHIVANNFEASSVGARAVAEFLAQCSEAIYAELVRSGEHGRNAEVGGVHVADTQKRPRFNPQPVVRKG